MAQTNAFVRGSERQLLLQSYHYAWLSEHPYRSEEWLKAKLVEGFDIHHLDGNHDNNDPANLVLIEHSDHMMLHGGRTLGRLKPRKISKDGSIESRVRLSRKRQARALEIYEQSRRKLPALATHDVLSGSPTRS